MAVRGAASRPLRRCSLTCAPTADVVKAVRSMDGMSARYSVLSILQKVSTRITNACKGSVNRVVYDITHKPRAPLSGNERIGFVTRSVNRPWALRFPA